MDSNVNNTLNCGESANPKGLVVIGANTGGPAALGQVIPKLPKDLSFPIIVMQQMRPKFTSLLARQLDDDSEISVREATDVELLKSGEVFIIPGGCGARICVDESLQGREYYLEIEELDDSPPKQLHKVDSLFQSAVAVFGASTIGVLLTGFGNDGCEGMEAIRKAGGQTIAQDELSSVLFDLPRFAIEAQVVDDVLPLYGVADRIVELVRDEYAEFIQKAAG
jgi:two-component system chemotaxis response regulator CheB